MVAETDAGHSDPMVVRVAVIDDDAGFRRVAVMLLRVRGYEIAGEAGGVATGRELIDRERPDAALIDRNLPDGNGAELARALSAEGGRSLRVVVMSSDDAIGDDPALAARFIPKDRLASIRLGDYLGAPTR
jgi:CheY-like chemotaxis protein